MHVLEFLERLAFEHIELIPLVPERSGIFAIDKVHPILLASQSAFLVDAGSVDEAVEVRLVGCSDAGHQEGETNNLELAPLGLVLDALFDSGWLELQALHRVFHDRSFYLI